MNSRYNEFEAELACAAAAAAYTQESEAMLGSLRDWWRRRRGTLPTTPAPRTLGAPASTPPASSAAPGASSPYRAAGVRTRADLQREIDAVQAALARLPHNIAAAEHALAELERQMAPIRRPPPGYVAEVERENRIINRLLATRRHLQQLRQHARRLPQRLIELRSLLAAAPESEAIFMPRGPTRSARTGATRRTGSRVLRTSPAIRRAGTGRNGHSNNGHGNNGHGSNGHGSNGHSNGQGNNGRSGGQGGSGQGGNGGGRRRPQSRVAALTAAVDEVAAHVEAQINLSPLAGQCGRPVALFRAARTAFAAALTNPPRAGGPSAVLAAQNRFHQSVNAVMRCLGLPTLL